MGINIIFLSFGDRFTMHLQTYFALITTLKYKGENDTVTVYTDHPERYERLKGHINIRILDAQTLSNWFNGTGFVLRAKIKAVEDMASAHPERHLLFLDGDTFVFGGFEDIRQMLDRGEGVLHAREDHPLKQGGVHKRMYDAVKGERIDGIEIGTRHDMWNSGVIGIPKDKFKDIIPLALHICDRILEKDDSRCFTTEQYAVSIAMFERLKLNTASKYIGHYWGNREQWLPYIQEMLVTSFMGNISVEQEITAIDLKPLKEWPVHVKRSNTKRRLNNLLTKIFPDKAYPRD